MPITGEASASSLEIKKHISFSLRCLRMLPQPYTSADDQRMTLGYFALSSLDLLNSLDKIPAEEKGELVDWIYDQQSPLGGFRGSPSTSSSSTSPNGAEGGAGNVAMTYAAILALAILQDPFTRLNRKTLLSFIGSLQDKSEQGGGFAAEVPQKPYTGELVDRDPRFTYCAVAICSMLGEWGEVDVELVRGYLEGCQRYDGGFGASELYESHSGMGYCCVAALSLLSNEGSGTWKRRDETITWLAHRQVALSHPNSSEQQLGSNTNTQDTSKPKGTDSEEESEEEKGEEELTGGFQGRPSKLPPDVCYSFWNAGALAILGQHGLIDAERDAEYVLSAQSRVGGISKMPGEHPDLLHTYLGLASLALHQTGKEEEEEGEIEFGLKRLDAGWNCSIDAKGWIVKHLTKQ